MRYSYFSFLVVVLCLVSCRENNPLSSNGSPGVIVPLHVGNTWVYQVITLDTLGDTLSVDTGMTQIMRDTLISTPGRWYVDNAGQFATVEPDGYWRLNGGRNLFLRYPVRAGEKYVCRDENGASSLEALVISKSVTLSVPQGEHSCYLYQFYNSATKGYLRYYVEPNVGIVAMVVMAPDASGGTYTSMMKELISYEIKTDSY